MMMLTPSRFNRLLNQMGQDFEWRKAYACPCLNPNSGQAQHNCVHCQGKGRLWSQGVKGKAGTVSGAQLKSFAQFGMWDAGDVMLSIPSDSPLYAIGQFDRVLAINRTEPFSMNFVRGQNDVLRFKPVSIERAFWLDRGQISDADPVSLLPDGRLLWGAKAPPMGTTYSLTGRRVPEYFCYQELPADRPMHFGQPLPRRVTLRRFDLMGS